MSMFTALELSKYIVTKCARDDCPISNLQLQKILYYIQKEFLKKNCVLFKDNIEAWPFGPVVRNVYYWFCGSGSMPIMAEYDPIDLCGEDRTIVDKIVDCKRQLDPWDMVEETHKPGGAWDQIYANGAGSYGVIPTDLIRKAG